MYSMLWSRDASDRERERVARGDVVGGPPGASDCVCVELRGVDGSRLSSVLVCVVGVCVCGVVFVGVGVGVGVVGVGAVAHGWFESVAVLRFALLSSNLQPSRFAREDQKDQKESDPKLERFCGS